MATHAREVPVDQAEEAPAGTGKPPIERPWLPRARAIAAAAGRKAQQSRLTTTSRLLPGVNGNSTWVRRCRDLISLHLSDLGGDDAVTQAEKCLTRRAAVLTTELERIEVQFALAETTDVDLLDAYQRASNTLRRLLTTLGLERRAKDLTPDPLTYRPAKLEPVAELEPAEEPPA